MKIACNKPTASIELFVLLYANFESEDDQSKDVILSYLAEDTNLIYLTYRVGQSLVAIYHIGHLA